MATANGSLIIAGTSGTIPKKNATPRTKTDATAATAIATVLRVRRLESFNAMYPRRALRSRTFVASRPARRSAAAIRRSQRGAHPAPSSVARLGHPQRTSLHQFISVSVIGEPRSSTACSSSNEVSALGKRAYQTGSHFCWWRCIARRQYGLMIPPISKCNTHRFDEQPPSIRPRFGNLGSRASELLNRAPGSAIGHGTTPGGKSLTRVTRTRYAPACWTDVGTETPLAMTDATFGAAGGVALDWARLAAFTSPSATSPQCNVNAGNTKCNSLFFNVPGTPAIAGVTLLMLKA